MANRMIEPGIEVSGMSLGAIVEGFGAFTSLAMKYLDKHGLVVPTVGKKPALDTTKWYPLEKWLAAHDAIAAEIGPSVMFDIGLSIPKNAKFPFPVKDIEGALQALDIGYHMNHRKNGTVMFDPGTGKMLEGIGHYGCQRVPGERKIIAVCDTTYPCQLDQGIYTALSRKFEPRALVTHDDNKPCRTKEGRSCTYIITW